jgi:hypothetical protein
VLPASPTPSTCTVTPLHHSSKVVSLTRQLLPVNLTADDPAGPLPLSLLAHITQVPACKALRLRCDAAQGVTWQVVGVLLQDGRPAGFIWQAKVDGQVKPATAENKPRQCVWGQFCELCIAVKVRDGCNQLSYKHTL